jgi:hypothetical protein
MGAGKAGGLNYLGSKQAKPYRTSTMPFGRKFGLSFVLIKTYLNPTAVARKK